MAVLRIYEIYLKMLNFSGYKHFSPSLLANYAELYRTKRLVSSLSIGYYLNILTRENDIQEYQDVVHEQMENGIRNIHAEMFSLQERIDVTKLVSDMEENLNQKIYSENLLGTIQWNTAPLGYKDGLARLLLLNVNKKTEFL
jgi:hypothetical protein